MSRKEQKCQQCGRKIFFDGICISCREENEKNRILALSEQEIDIAIQQICSDIENACELGDEGLFTKLLNFRDINTSKIAEIAFAKNVFSPRDIYKDAPADIVKSMIEILMQDDTDPSIAGNILLCLAACGGEEVFNAFLELEKHPRKWREKLYVNPSFYATYGGWSYDSNGSFIKTNFDKCYPMKKGTLEEKERSPVKIGVKTDDKCPHCGCQIVNLIEIDGSDPRLDFIGIEGVIKAKCCPNCFAFSGGDFCKYSINGESEIIFGKERGCDEDYLKDEGITELVSNTYVLGDNPVPLRYAANWEGGSSVGGFAFWIQDCEIIHCPECGKLMTYLAQIQWDTVLAGMEGNAYIEICKDCHIMAVLHQQT